MKTKVKSIVFQDRNEVVCTTEEKVIEPDADGVVLETLYSCISAGTEPAK